MIKMITKKINYVLNAREFYCDKCGVYLGTSEEHEDGYYEDIGRYIQKFYVSGYGWCELNKHLCDGCALKMTNTIIKRLQELGFTTIGQNESNISD